MIASKKRLVEQKIIMIEFLFDLKFNFFNSQSLFKEIIWGLVKGLQRK